MRRGTLIIRSKLKAAFDRRYITRSELSSINQTTSRLSKDVDDCANKLDAVADAIDAVRLRLDGPSNGSVRNADDQAELAADTRRLVRE